MSEITLPPKQLATDLASISILFYLIVPAFGEQVKLKHMTTVCSPKTIFCGDFDSQSSYGALWSMIYISKISTSKEMFKWGPWNVPGRTLGGCPADFCSLTSDVRKLVGDLNSEKSQKAGPVVTVPVFLHFEFGNMTKKSFYACAMWLENEWRRQLSSYCGERLGKPLGKVLVGLTIGTYAHSLGVGWKYMLKAGLA